MAVADGKLLEGSDERRGAAAAGGRLDSSGGASRRAQGSCYGMQRAVACVWDGEVQPSVPPLPGAPAARRKDLILA